MSEAGENGLKARIDAVEEAYEFMLAYAAQGHSGDETSGPSTEIREQLGRADRALEGLAGLLRDIVIQKELEPASRYRSFIEIIEQDASRSQSAIQLVLAQPTIGSQLIDNLNALIHVRALLTDLFLIDETLKRRKFAEEKG